MATLLQESCKMQSLFLMVTCPVEYSLTKEEGEMGNEEQLTAFTILNMDTTHVPAFTWVEMPPPNGSQPWDVRKQQN